MQFLVKIVYACSGVRGLWLALRVGLICYRIMMGCVSLYFAFKRSDTVLNDYTYIQIHHAYIPKRGRQTTRNAT